MPAENIEGKTIYSTLRIKDLLNNRQSLAMHDQNLRQELKKIKPVIIDEVSMVAAEMLSFIMFISDLFMKLHNKPIEFGSAPILLIRDLAQLPPIKGAQTFFSPAWKRFFPLFLSFSRRQQNDLPFYALLQNMRMGMITDDDRNMILEKVKQPPTTSTPSETTFVTGFKQLAHNLNTTIASQLPLQNVFLHTVHKTQGLTLPHTITVLLDTSMFACGQAYIDMSRVTSWQDLDIMYFDLVSIKADKRVIKE